MSENIAELAINKPTELLKQYIGRSCSVICFYQKINNIGTFAFSATVFVFCVNILLGGEGVP